MIDLLKLINAKLLTLHPRVFLEQADKDAVFPYVVFNLPFSNPDEQREDFILEIDVWGNDTDTLGIEALTSLIDGNGKTVGATGFNRFHYFAAGVLQADFYRINRLMIPDPDENIRRRQLRYQIKTYL